MIGIVVLRIETYNMKGQRKKNKLEKRGINLDMRVT